MTHGKASSRRGPRSGGAIAGRRPVLEAVRSGRASEVLIAASVRRTQALADLRRAAESAGVPVREVARSDLDRLAADHHGVVALSVGTAPGRSSLDERALAERAWGPEDVVVVLDGITDPQNLGSAARSAEAAGAAALVTRRRRAAPVSQAAVRASAGALLHLPHAHVANIPRALDRLKDAGFTVAGLDGGAPRSIAEEPAPPGRLALVIGSEGEGMARRTRDSCDLLVSLPMHGRVGSLNAAAALAAALYAWVLPRRAQR